MENFTEKLNNRLAKLKADGFKVITSSILKPDPLKKVNAVFKNINVPSAISDFCRQVGAYTITIENKTLTDKPIISTQSFLGIYAFRTSEKILQPKTELGITAFAPEEFFILEYLTYGNMVLLSTKPNCSGLFLYTYHKHLNKLNISLDNYFEKMLAHLGEDLWQQNYIDTPSNISSFYLTEESLTNSKTNYKTLLEENRVRLKIRNKPKYNTGASANLLMKCQETMGVKFPDEILHFYSETNGLKLNWNKKQLNGSINLLSLEAAISGKPADIYDYHKWTYTHNHKEKIGHIETDDDTFALAEKLCVLEDFVGDSGLLGFILNKKNNIQLYYRVSRGEISKLNISWTDFLNIHLELLGYWCWIEVKKEGLDKIWQGNTERENLSTLFPNFDLNRLKD